MTNNKRFSFISMALATGIISASLTIVGVKLGAFGKETLEKDTHTRAGQTEQHDHGSRKGVPEHHDEHSEHDEKEVILLSQAEVKEFALETAQVTPGKLHIEVSLPGKVVLNPDRLAHLVPRSPGIVRQVQKKLGDMVRQGEIMAWLESVELGEAKVEYLSKHQKKELALTDLDRMQAIHDNTSTMLALLKTSPSTEKLKQLENLEMGENRSLLISAYAQLNFAQNIYTREKQLYEEGKISSQGEFLSAENELKKAEAGYIAMQDSLAFLIKRSLLEAQKTVRVDDFEEKAAQTHLLLLGMSEKDIQELADSSENDNKLAWYALTAPITGTIIEKHITLGEMLGNNAKAFTIADFDQVWVYLNIYPKYLPNIRKGQKVVISDGGTFPDFTSSISYVVPFVGEETRTALARVVLPNQKRHWRPGSFVTGMVSVEEVVIPVLIPRTALQVIDDQQIVFVQMDKGFKPQAVKIGRTDSWQVEILAGLHVGDFYVKKGGFILKAELAKGNFDSGHHH